MKANYKLWELNIKLRLNKRPKNMLIRWTVINISISSCSMKYKKRPNCLPAECKS